MPGLAGPRVPRPNAAVPTSPSCVALGLRLSSRSYRPNRVNGKGSPGKGKTSPIPRPKNPPDGTAVSRLKASIPRPPRPNRTATASHCSVLRPKGGAVGKSISTGPKKRTLKNAPPALWRRVRRHKAGEAGGVPLDSVCNLRIRRLWPWPRARRSAPWL